MSDELAVYSPDGAESHTVIQRNRAENRRRGRSTMADVVPAGNEAQDPELSNTVMNEISNSTAIGLRPYSEHGEEDKEEAVEPAQNVAGDPHIGRIGQELEDQAAQQVNRDACTCRNSQVIVWNDPVYNQQILNQWEPSIEDSRQNISESVAAYFPQYTAERDRRESYALNNWPIWDIQHPTVLAYAGLFYSGECDMVRCYWCGGRIQNWALGESPMIQHARYFSFCDHICNLIPPADMRLIMNLQKQISSLSRHFTE